MHLLARDLLFGIYRKMVQTNRFINSFFFLLSHLLPTYCRCWGLFLHLI